MNGEDMRSASIQTSQGSAELCVIVVTFNPTVIWSITICSRFIFTLHSSHSGVSYSSRSSILMPPAGLSYCSAPFIFELLAPYLALFHSLGKKVPYLIHVYGCRPTRYPASQDFNRIFSFLADDRPNLVVYPSLELDCSTLATSELVSSSDSMLSGQLLHLPSLPFRERRDHIVIRLGFSIRTVRANPIAIFRQPRVIVCIAPWIAWDFSV